MPENEPTTSTTNGPLGPAEGLGAEGPQTGSTPPRSPLAQRWRLADRIAPIARSYQRIIRLLLWLVTLPALLLSAVGVFLLLRGQSVGSWVLGILVLVFCVTLATGSILVWVFVHQQKNLSELQLDFVSKVSHELRTPLTSIRMFTETLAMRRGDAQATELCIEALGRESSRLQRLIDRLLDWGRMESGRRAYQMQEEDMGAIVREAIDTYEPTRAGRVEVREAIEKGLPAVWCDRAAMVDVFVNLLSNAHKYGNGEPVEVGVTSGDGRVAVSVKDRGMGIPRREHQRIFERFYRVDDLLARQQEGSGLGLAIAQHIVRAHKGKIDVDSEPGRGSTFTVALPLGIPKHVLKERVRRTASAEEVEHGGFA